MKIFDIGQKARLREMEAIGAAKGQGYSLWQ